MVNDSESALCAVSVRRSFGATHALKGVNLTVNRGEIHALLGGNGSGKSTLVKILSGVLPADEGEILVDDQRIDVKHWSAVRARAANIHVVHQDGATFPDLNVAENLAVGRGFDRTALGRVRWRVQNRRAAKVLERFGIDAAPDTPMAQLRPAERMMVAIARALQDQDVADRGLLILDEPTAALSNDDADRLLAALQRYADAGQAILYVSHRLDEVLRIARRLTVLRNGVVAAQQEVGDMTEARLAELIIGRELSDATRSSSATARGDRLLEVVGLQGGPVRHASLSVRRGEVVGVAGSLGSGRSHLLKLIYGAEQPTGGSIVLADKRCRDGSPRRSIAAGVALIPEDRLKQASFPDLSVRENLSAASVSKYWRHLRLARRREKVDAEDSIQRYGISTSSPHADMSMLSGGNQQKVVLGRWLSREPAILLLDEPTQGVDAGAREHIYRLIHAAVDRGAGALVVASDFEELVRVCDRVVVMARGRTCGELVGADLTVERLTEQTFEVGMRPAKEERHDD